MAVTEEVLGTFHGSDEFPIQWREGERDLFWIYDDLHIPNPVSPMFFDIGGWWLTCDHMFRRFGTPFACDWIAKEINGYVYTAAVPCESDLHSEATEYQSRYVPRVPRDLEHAAQIGTYLGWVLPEYAGNFLAWWRERLRRDRTKLRLPRRDRPRRRDHARLAVYLEDAIDVPTVTGRSTGCSTSPSSPRAGSQRGDRGGPWRGGPRADGPPAVEPRRPQLDSIEDLWKIKEEIKDGELAAAFEGQTAEDVGRALEGFERGRRLIEERIVRHRGLRLQVDLVARVRVQDLARGPGADPGGSPRLPGHRLRLPSNIASVRDDLGRPSAR